MFGQSGYRRLGLRYALQKPQKRGKRSGTIHHQQPYGTHRHHTRAQNAQRTVHRHRIQRQCLFRRTVFTRLDKRLDYARMAHGKQGRGQKRRFVERTSLSYANSRSEFRQSQRTCRQRAQQPLRLSCTHCD